MVLSAQAALDRAAAHLTQTGAALAQRGLQATALVAHRRQNVSVSSKFPGEMSPRCVKNVARAHRPASAHELSPGRRG